MKGMMPTSVLCVVCSMWAVSVLGCGDGEAASTSTVPDSSSSIGGPAVSGSSDFPTTDAPGGTPSSGAADGEDSPADTDVVSGPADDAEGSEPGADDAGPDDAGVAADGDDPTGCQTDEDCAHMTTGMECRVASCNVETGICSVATADEGTPCGADDPCKLAGACGGGLCISQPAKCDDDGDPCTDGICKPWVGCEQVPNTAPCDDGDPCTGNDVCALRKCSGTPVAECAETCGNDFCDEGEDCLNCAVDCSPCATGLCGDDEVENCEGGCSAETEVGDGTCQSALDCAETGFDGGDCVDPEPTGTCSELEVEVCDGSCVGANVFAEMLINATCDEALNCSTYDFDMGECVGGGGDCEASDFICADGDGCVSVTSVCDGDWDCADGSDEAGCSATGACPDGKEEGCTGSCYIASWFGDGTCDSFLDCESTGWDGGDCSATTGGDDPLECEDGQVLVCAETYCLPASWMGDGTCDQPLDCAATSLDGGDCEAVSPGGVGDDLTCQADKQANCAGTYCYNSAWIDDGTCDSFFDCSSTGWDGGDCL